MTSQKKNIIALILFCVLYFVAFCFPNQAASRNIDMVSVLQPDEAVPLPYAFNMIKAVDSAKQALKNFAFYSYYFYGYPHFAFSAIALLPLELTNSISQMPLVMLTLRQIISVLPMLVAVLLLVYLQTKYKTYKALLLLILLLGLPALVENNFWWHPDSLAILCVVLTIFFLNKDNLRMGGNFFLSAVMCGFATGTKNIGWYFFLTIFVYLIFALINKKVTLIKTIYSGIGYILTMGAAYVFSNPLFILASIRQQYLNTMRSQFDFLTTGYGIIYAKGLLASIPSIREYYGAWAFIFIAFGTCIWATIRGPNRLLNLLILTWSIPLSVFVLTIIHFKYQYWLPAILPLFSSLVLILPENINDLAVSFRMERRKLIKRIFRLVLLIILVAQFSSYLVHDISQFNNKLHAEETNPTILFYNKVLELLHPLPKDGPYYVYHDVRMYVPETNNWVRESRFEMLNYDYIEQSNFNVLLLLQQRINTYLEPSAEGIDPAEMAKSRVFYQDANNGDILGYELLYRDDTGLIFIRDDLFRTYFRISK